MPSRRSLPMTLRAARISIPLPKGWSPGCRAENLQEGAASVSAPSCPPPTCGLNPAPEYYSATAELAPQGMPMLDLTFTAPEPKVIQGAKHDWELVIGM